ncbi:hypothetical protein PAPHI01_0267 [Pancytospora philotis]|nr:hypothetical protein PAPHI01_0267 [Pancytospora philotis]
MFKITGSLNGLFKHYRTPTERVSAAIPPQLRSIGETPYLLLPLEHAFCIYRLEDLTLHFLSPAVGSIAALCFNDHDVLLCEGSLVHRVDRGEIVSTYSLGARACIEYPGAMAGTHSGVKGMCRFGEYLVLLTREDQLVVLKHRSESADPLERAAAFQSGNDSTGPADSADFVSEVSRFSLGAGAQMIYHPYTYLNKILVVYETGVVELYNINKGKLIFSFDFGARVLAVKQTSVLDVLGFLLDDGTLRVFDIKKNKLVFDIVEYRLAGGAKLSAPEDAAAISNYQLDFKDKYALVLINGRLSVYDLEIKRELFQKQGVLSALLVSQDTFFVATADAVSLYNMDDFSLFKTRFMLSGPVRSVTALSDREVLFVGSEKLFKMNVYKDEQNTYLKNKRSIDSVAVGKHLLVSGEGQLSYLNPAGAPSSFIDKKCKWCKTYDDFCLFGTGSGCKLMNLKSKRIVLDFKLAGAGATAAGSAKEFNYQVDDGNTEILDGDFNNEKLSILTASRLLTFNYKKELVFSYDVTSLTAAKASGDYTVRPASAASTKEAAPVRPTALEIRGSLYFLHGGNDLAVVCNTVARAFKADRYAVDFTNKFIATVYDCKLALYDIVTGCLIERVSANVAIKDVAIVDRLKFIGLLDTDDDFHLLFNQSYLDRAQSTLLSTRRGRSSLGLSLAKKESGFARDMAMYKEFGARPDEIIEALQKDEVLELLKLIETNIDDAAAKSVLAKILRLKSHLLAPEDVARLHAHIEKAWAKSEDVLVKTLGYLKVSQKQLL